MLHLCYRELAWSRYDGKTRFSITVFLDSSGCPTGSIFQLQGLMASQLTNTVTQEIPFKGMAFPLVLDICVKSAFNLTVHWFICKKNKKMGPLNMVFILPEESSVFSKYRNSFTDPKALFFSAFCILPIYSSCVYNYHP